MRKTVCLMLILLVGILSCIYPRRSSSTSSAIGMNVYYRYGKRKLPFWHIYFSKIDSSKNIFSQKNSLGSNFYWNGTVYITNLKPGRYIAFAASFKETSEFETKTTNKTYFFPKNMIRKTVIDLGPSEFRYMGSYIIDKKAEPSIKEFYKIKNADNVQLHYCSLINPEHAKPSVGSCIMGELDSEFSSTYELSYAAFLISSNNGRNAELKFLKKSINTFSGSNWIPLIKRRMKR